MRITGQKAEIEYDKTKAFYDYRAGKYNEEHPYLTTMCQDHHPEIAEQRNQLEVFKILPALHLTQKARVLDIGCGVGRWADAIPKEIRYYLGCDFSAQMIKIAKSRNKKANFNFAVVSAMDVKKYCKHQNIPAFTHIIISGILMYLNDVDVKKVLQSLTNLSQPGTIVYIREPMGIEARLTLKDFYSEELQHEYNTIYRARNEYQEMIAMYAPEFEITAHGAMFEQAALNNRKETAQFYYILQKIEGRCV